MNLDGLKVKCIGFSVTTFGKPNYPQVMQKFFDDRGVKVEVTYASVGGLSVDSLPYLLQNILQKNQTDIVILEVATSWFSLVRKNEGEAEKYLELIIQYIESMNSSILFLNMYRNDISDEDSIVQGIRKIAKNKYPILDYKKYFRRMLDENGSDGTTDGVHPIPEVIDLIANKVCLEIINYLPKFQKYYAEIKNNDIYKLNTFNLLEKDVYDFNNHSGLILQSRKLRQHEKIKIVFEQKTRISGLFYLLGPDTNQLSVYFDGICINIPMRDEASYYRRLGYRYLGAYECTEIILEHPDEYLNVKLTREPWEKVDFLCNYIVGFSSHI